MRTWSGPRTLVKVRRPDRPLPALHQEVASEVLLQLGRGGAGPSALVELLGVGGGILLVSSSATHAMGSEHKACLWDVSQGYELLSVKEGTRADVHVCILMHTCA